MFVAVRAPAVWASEPSIDVLITEFVASNDSSLADENGCFPDWIELHNPCQPSVDLTGWYLTDDANNLTMWQFPAVTLARGEFLVVFASGMDRTDPLATLHTNFRLSAGGEYLALVRPDGVTVEQEFGPTYPPHVTDESYGFDQVAATLVATGDLATYHVPTLADDALGSTWTESDLDDTAWLSDEIGFGFINSAAAEFDVTYYKANITVSNLATAEDVISDPTKQSEVASETAPVINYLNSGGSAHYSGDAPFPGTTLGSGLNDFVMEATTTVIIPTAGDWSFGVNSDDGFGLELSNGVDVFGISFPGTRGPGDTIGVFNITTPGPYDLRLVFFERGGGSEVELFAAEGSHTTWNAQDFDLVGDTANGGLSVVGFGGDFRTDVEADMLDTNASLWARIDFDVVDPSLFAVLSMEIKYEDGYVAYLNGQEVAQSNAPAMPAWDSVALGDRPLADAFVAELVDLSADVGLLQPGSNTLAVHAMNDAASDPEFLLAVKLTAVQAVGDLTGNFFVEPTPGDYNGLGLPGYAGTPTFSEPGRTFVGLFSVTLTPDDVGATIRYTFDGSEPTASNGTDYTGPIQISDTTRIRARQFEPGLLPGPIVGATFVELGPDVADFDSNLPLIILENYGAGNVPADPPQAGSMSIFEPVNGRTALADGPVLHTHRLQDSRIEYAEPAQEGLYDRGSR